eukprot:scaffold478643_cov17-Prasinocladus_malaysianus.AAC.1
MCNSTWYPLALPMVEAHLALGKQFFQSHPEKHWLKVLSLTASSSLCAFIDVGVGHIARLSS